MFFQSTNKMFINFYANNLLESDTLPPVSNCKFSLSERIDVAKKSLFLQRI